MRRLIFAIPFIFIVLAPTKFAIGPDPACIEQGSHKTVSCAQRFKVKPPLFSKEFYTRGSLRYYSLPEEKAYNEKNLYIFGGLLAICTLLPAFIARTKK